MKATKYLGVMVSGGGILEGEVGHLNSAATRMIGATSRKVKVHNTIRTEVEAGIPAPGTQGDMIP